MPDHQCTITAPEELRESLSSSLLDRGCLGIIQSMEGLTVYFSGDTPSGKVYSHTYQNPGTDMVDSWVALPSEHVTVF